MTKFDYWHDNKYLIQGKYCKIGSFKNIASPGKKKISKHRGQSYKTKNRR